MYPLGGRLRAGHGHRDSCTSVLTLTQDLYAGCSSLLTGEVLLLTLLQESGHAFHLVGGGEAQAEQVGLQLQAAVQIGVGTEGFRITGPDETWDQFLEGRDDLESAKTYIQLRTRMIFDPPTSSAAIEAIKETIKEYEWRLYEQAQE